MSRNSLAALLLALGMTACVCGQDLLEHLTRSQDGRSRRASSTDADIDANGDSKTIEPGKTLVVADLEGPGVINHIWNTTASLYPFSGRSLVLLGAFADVSACSRPFDSRHVERRALAPGQQRLSPREAASEFDPRGPPQVVLPTA